MQTSHGVLYYSKKKSQEDFIDFHGFSKKISEKIYDETQECSLCLKVKLHQLVLIKNIQEKSTIHSLNIRNTIKKPKESFILKGLGLLCVLHNCF